MGPRTTRLRKNFKCPNKFKQIKFSYFGVLYEITVKFQKGLLEIDENKINIGIESKPVKGEANKEIIKKLSKHFQIPASSIQIKSGHKSKRKIVEIQP